MDKYEKLMELKELLEKGIITEEEFNNAKERLRNTVEDADSSQLDEASKEKEEAKEKEKEKGNSKKTKFIIAGIVAFIIICLLVATGTSGFDDENAVAVTYDDLGKVIYSSDNTTVKFMGFDLEDIGDGSNPVIKLLFATTTDGTYDTISIQDVTIDYKDAFKTTSTNNEETGIQEIGIPNEDYAGEGCEIRCDLWIDADEEFVPVIFTLGGSEEYAKSVIRFTNIFIEPGAYSFSDPRLYINFVNLSNRTIKYLNFEIKYYNSVGDVVQEGDYENIEIVNSYYTEGPYYTGEGMSGNSSGWDISVENAVSAELSGLEIEYMDGSIQCFDEKMIKAVRY